MATGSKKLLRRFSNDETGATAIEYGLIASLIFLVVIGSIQAMTAGQQLQYQKINNAVSGALSP